MKNLLSLIKDSPGKIKIELTSEDLVSFSRELINQSRSEISLEIVESKKERYLTKQEVKEMCGVCDATLWHWDKKNYLKKLKIGNKVKYRFSDVKNLIEGKSNQK